MSFTLPDLRQVMRDSAGQSSNVDLDGDIIDTSFEDLGYDSLALLEIVGVVERQTGALLDDDVVSEVETPRELLDAVDEADDTVSQPA